MGKDGQLQIFGFLYVNFIYYLYVLLYYPTVKEEISLKVQFSPDLQTC